MKIIDGLLFGIGFWLALVIVFGISTFLVAFLKNFFIAFVKQIQLKKIKEEYDKIAKDILKNQDETQDGTIN